MISAVVLLNMLIAIMSNTLVDVLQEQGQRMETISGKSKTRSILLAMDKSMRDDVVEYFLIMMRCSEKQDTVLCTILNFLPDAADVVAAVDDSV